MQANCLLFPSPKDYNIRLIEDKIVLIPRAPGNNRHGLYHPTCTPHSFHSDDPFQDYLASSEENTTAEKYLSKSFTRSEVGRENTGQLEGNLNLNQKVNSQEYIPCLFLPASKPKLILFFHANGEDLSSAYEFLRLVSQETKYPLLAMEYRGYSIYEGESTPRNIEADACRVIQFLQAKGVSNGQIILCGRSIGCAIALTLTQKYATHSATLLSPFLSLKRIARDLYGGCAEAMISEAFENQENCKQVQCPLLIIHGSKDALVSYQHSLQLMSSCQTYCRVKVIENMTHTRFNFRWDFVRHFADFLADLD